MDEDWGKTLFGPKGILTALFKVIDGMQKRNKMHDGEQEQVFDSSHSQKATLRDLSQADISLLPDFLTNRKNMPLIFIIYKF